MKTIFDIARKLKGQVVHTDGRGLWSHVRKPTVIKRVEIEEDQFADTDGKMAKQYLLKVFLTRKSWNTDTDGLVYTDERWIKEFRKALKEAGYKRWKDVGYTEQGMQGDDYVHLIMGDW